MTPARRAFPFSRAGWASLLFLVVLASLGAAAPMLPLPDPTAVDVAGKFALPSSSHWLGTDVLGRDILSRLIWATRTSFFTAVAAALATASLGALWGGIAAVSVRAVDEAMMRFSDFWMAFPSEIVILAFVGALGPGLENIILAAVAAKWPWYARMIRLLAERLRGSGFVHFARASGASRRQVLFGHFIPNSRSDFCVLATTDAAGILLMISGLSFLGLGVEAPNPEWGMMLADAKDVLSIHPWQMLPPGLMILLSAGALNFLGDALSEALDPKTDGMEGLE